MTLHIFNPEHDLALASDLSNFTAPHAARKLKSELGFLPAMWAADSDLVLVDNREYAEKTFCRLNGRMRLYGCANNHTFRFVEPDELRSATIDRIEPWGWDKALRAYINRCGVDSSLLPGDDTLEDIRAISHRRTASALLARLNVEGTVGESVELKTIDEVRQRITILGKAVLKAPWSSSGRGVRFVDGEMSTQIEGWTKNTLKNQGSLMVEPYYRKVKDFGMEFCANADGTTSYLGLSLFDTVNGAYTGNILASENEKRAMMAEYIPCTMLDSIQQNICRLFSNEVAGRYAGPFGVDMMIVAKDNGEGFLLHPCVEINLRRTMGHVALSISPRQDEIRKLMRITVENSCQLRILNSMFKL